ncbi:MAG: pilus assembly protein TadC [Rhodobacterales bacterium]|nr:MAG: pilus assembly protein TadC [Rhodobacterales bacterium]
MEALKLMLEQQFGPMGPLYAIVVLAVLLLAFAGSQLLKRDEDPLDKLKRDTHPANSGDKKSLRSQVDTGPDKLERYKAFLEPQDAEEYSAMKLTLLQAGYEGKNAVRHYHFAQFALGLLALALGLGYVWLNSGDGETSTRTMILSIIIPGAVGYYAPKYWITRRVEERKDQIICGFPDALDMMLVCVEAGQSLDQSIARVSGELRAGFPALADEFEIVSNEMKAGKDRIAVLRDFGERCGVPDVMSFSTVLIQSATFGTSVGDALRVFSEEMRDKRVMRAEEKANTLPTKMTLATMMLTVPPLLIILIGPSVYEVYKVLQEIKF